MVASPHQTVIGGLILAVSKLPPVPLPSFEVTSKLVVHTVLNGIPAVVASVVVTDIVRFSGCIQACRVICRWWWLPVWPQAADGGKAKRTNGTPLQRGQTVAAGKTDGRERKHFEPVISQHPPLAYYVLFPVLLWGRSLTIYDSQTTLLTEVNICKNISWFYLLPFTHCLLCALRLTVLWAMHRRSMGGLNGPANILPSELVIRLGWSHAVSVCKEMLARHYGGVTLLCMRPLPD